VRVWLACLHGFFVSLPRHLDSFVRSYKAPRFWFAVRHQWRFYDNLGTGIMILCPFAVKTSCGMLKAGKWSPVKPRLRQRDYSKSKRRKRHGNNDGLIKATGQLDL
jgi:hypothetical protein